MGHMKWTPAQEEALFSRNQNLLLAASAGSGKTAVLTARIKELLTDTTHPVDVTDLLILTFTRAAAGEMKARVASNLSEAMHEAEARGDHATGRLLSRQLSHLSSAQISTLDSFFQSLIRQYFYLIDMDPDTKILSDENDIYLLQEEVLTELMETWYQKKDSAFTDCVEFLSSGWKDTAFKEAVRSLYQFSCSMPFPLHWLENLARPYDISPNTHLSDLPFAQEILSHYHDLVSDRLLSYRRILSAVETMPPVYAAYYETLEKEALLLHRLAEEKDWSTWQNILQNFTFDRLQAVRKDKTLPPEAQAEVEAVKQQVKDIRDSIKKELKEKLIPLFSIPESTWLTQMRTMYPLVKILTQFTIDFFHAYRARKKADGLMEFNDMEHYALDILLDKNHPQFTPETAENFPSAVALSLREKYKEIMIDEYQDTNGVQELIATLISNGKNRFMVGDIKQSIYRFRQADPSIFLRKYESFSQDKDASHRRIDLNQNFRSDSTILSSINYIFRQLMNKEQLELSYGDKEALVPGLPPVKGNPRYVGGEVSFEIIDQGESSPDKTAEEDVDGITLEGRLIAKKIKEIMEDHKQVRNPDGTFRDVRYSDIVVLLRTMDKRAPLFLKTFAEEDIPAVADRDDDFMKSTEVQTLWALLKIIDNPLQDLPLLSVLRSPFCGLTETDFSLLRLADTTAPLWDVVQNHRNVLPPFQQDRIQEFLENYEEWHRISYQNGVAPLLHHILESSDYLTWISGLPNGPFRKAHVQAFYDLALTRDTNQSNSLFSFLDYLQQSKKAFRSISPATEGNAVRIMSIHRSKGLEFGVVFLACTTKKFNMSDTQNPLIFHRTEGLGIHYYDKIHQVHWKTLLWDAVSLKVKKEALAEEARLLYVALTRAKDKLYITSTVKKGTETLSQILSPLALPEEEPMQFLPNHTIAYAASYQDWLLPAIARHSTAQNLWSFVGLASAVLHDHPKDHATAFSCRITAYTDLIKRKEPSQDIPSSSFFTEDLSTFLNTPVKDVPQWLENQLTWRYDHTPATLTPSKLTATAAVSLREDIANQDADELLPPTILYTEDLPEKKDEPLPTEFETAPGFIENRPKTSGTSYGTLMHKAMEMIDFLTLSPTEEAIQKEIKKLTENHIFSPEERNILLASYGNRSPVKDIRQFMTGPLGNAMKKARLIRKEMPFSLLRKAKEFYPDTNEEETIFIQGVMDCLLEMEDGIIIIDYKTDRGRSAEELRAHYEAQLRVYEEAAEQLLGQKVIGLYLWSFHLGKEIAI